jgi:predicted GH43/DUF377 family glycosyl hydrolase
VVYLNRHPGNPILEKLDGLPWAKGSVLNPTVFYEEGIYKMAFRATNDIHIDKPGMYVSSIGYAESLDGIHFTVRPTALITPDEEYENNLGCEDPRITKIDGTYFMYYTAVGHGVEEIYYGWKIRTALATSRDLINWTKHGIVGPKVTPCKASCLLPEKVNGKYLFYYTLIPDNPNSSIMCAELDSIEEVINPPASKIAEFSESGDYEKYVVFRPSKKSFRGPEVGAVPIKTKYGWLFIYCPENATKGPLWTIGAALLDLKDPRKIIAQSKEPILQPATKDEISGIVNNVTFPEGALIVEENGREMLYVYYGSGDQGICLATCGLNELLNDLMA